MVRSSTQNPDVPSAGASRADKTSLPPYSKGQHVYDVIFRMLCFGSALLVLGLMVLLIAVLTYESIPSFKVFGLRFFVTDDWDPQAKLGALPFIYGTLVTSLIGMLIAVPLGVGTAAFLAEIAPGIVRRAGSFLIELLAAIPSVVYGFWGFFYLRPRVLEIFNSMGHTNTTGNGLVCAGLILSIMILPYITAIAFDVCRAVPHSQREGSLALGSTRWQMIRSVVLPYARPGIIGGCFLALGRALGETMAVMMLIGNSNEISYSFFGQGATVASVIASELNESGGVKKSALVELGLILLLVTIVVNCLARLLIWQVGRRGKNSSWLNVRRLVGGSRTHANSNGRPLPLPSSLNPQKVDFSGRNRIAWLVNNIMTGVLGSCLIITVVPLFLILGNITVLGISAVDLTFFTNLPNDKPPGLGHAIYGTGLLVGLTTLFAVPVGILAAIFLVEYKTSRLAPLVRFVGELLGGVPSIVIGILGYFVLVKGYGWYDHFGMHLGHFSGWAGIFALFVMMIPIVMRATEESLKLVPASLRSASYALGAAHWQTVLRVSVPAALPAIITGVFLAIARIAGETAPLLLTANNSNFWRYTPDQPTPFLTFYINKYFSSPLPDEQRLSWAAAFVLLTLVMALNVGIRLATGKRMMSAARAD
jgi:phosphate transport system permease protein